MLFQHAVLLSAWVALVHAHFQLQFPSPRGPFVENDEPTFCGKIYKLIGNQTHIYILSRWIQHPSKSLHVSFNWRVFRLEFGTYTMDR